MERLDKIVSVGASCSRKDARGMILKGEVSVNGRRVTDIALKVDAEKDNISVGTEDITYKKYVYIMMNKPRGILSASNDKSRETVVDLVKDDYNRPDLFPVGRLDKDTTGFLIITDDGDFGHKVMSPKSHIEKEYIAVLDKSVTDSDIATLGKGVTLTDGTQCRPAVVSRNGSDTVVSVTVTEGKYHEIKRIFGVVGIGVNELSRKRIGELCIDCKLLPGEYREMTPEELALVWK